MPFWGKRNYHCPSQNMSQNNGNFAFSHCFCNAPGLGACRFSILCDVVSTAPGLTDLDRLTFDILQGVYIQIGLYKIRAVMRYNNYQGFGIHINTTMLDKNMYSIQSNCLCLYIFQLPHQLNQSMITTVKASKN